MLPSEPAEPFVKLFFRFNENNTCLEKNDAIELQNDTIENMANSKKRRYFIVLIFCKYHATAISGDV